ncbi:MAG TPA: glycosyltransferase family 4 protein [Actinomycetes bacterium]
MQMARTRQAPSAVARAGGRRPYRLAVLNSHPIQYFAPLYRRLAARPELDLTVFYCSDQGARSYHDREFGRKVAWDVPLLDGYRHQVLPNLRHGGRVEGFTSLVNPGIVGALARGRFDALWLHSYHYATHCLAVAAARLTGTPVMYRTESSLTYDRHVARSATVRLLKPPLLRALFRQVRCFLSIGTLNTEFYLHHGVRPQDVFLVPYTVDNDWFAEQAARHRPSRTRIRAELGIDPDAVVFVFPAKMTPLKRPLDALRAYQRIPPGPPRALLMAGDGELRAEAERYAERYRLDGVRFLGFVNQSELPRVYAASDVLLRPDGVSRGDWGLTVNEAMAAGLAVIATDCIAASADLVEPGGNGFVVRYGDLDDLSRAMSEIAADPDGCRRMGRRSAEIVARWSYEECVQGVLAALRHLGPPRGGSA